MELRDYINAALQSKSSMESLADHLGVSRQNLTAAKAHRRGLPADACMKLSKLLGVPFETVIAASELATERKEEKRAFWLPFVTNQNDLARIAGYALILSIVTNFVTPTSAEAAPLLEVRAERVCIM